MECSDDAWDNGWPLLPFNVKTERYTVFFVGTSCVKLVRLQ